MTSISGSLTASTVQQSPRARINARLEAATNAGTISKTDETALSGALDDIDKALSSGTSASTGNTQASGTDMKSKIDSLIDQEVKDGKLTDDQASELKDLFGSNGPQQAAAADGTDPTATTGKAQAGGHVHHGHHKKAASSDDGSTTTTASSTDSTTSKLDTLISLLQKLRDSMASTDTYGGTTTSANSTSQTALLVDKSA